MLIPPKRTHIDADIQNPSARAESGRTGMYPEYLKYNRIPRSGGYRGRRTGGSPESDPEFTPGYGRCGRRGRLGGYGRYRGRGPL